MIEINKSRQEQYDFVKQTMNAWSVNNPDCGIQFLGDTTKSGEWKLVNNKNFQDVIMTGSNEFYGIAQEAWNDYIHDSLINNKNPFPNHYCIGETTADHTTYTPLEQQKRSQILQQVEKTLQERQANYEPPKINFAKIARAWSIILGIEVTPQQVSLMFIMMKVIRENHAHTFDNLLDIVGYTLCLEEIEE